MTGDPCDDTELAAHPVAGLLGRRRARDARLRGRRSARPALVGGPAIDWPPVAIYSVTFLMFWGAIATAGALTALLSLTAEELNARGDAGSEPVTDRYVR